MRLIRALIAALPVVPLLAVVAVAGPAPAAQAEPNGVGLTPAMGWSSWSFLRHGPDAQKIEAQAKAMKSSGLAKVGYQYVNLDDFWYVCPGSQGPGVDQYGRWVIDTSKFPSDAATGQNGIQVVASYVHKLGLKFGLYMTPGISKQAVAQNTPILGPDGKPTGYTADQIAEPSVSENNYNCGGMVGIDYSKPGAQDFINSWADQFASWGVDYLKLDGVGSFDIPDVQAWSTALQQTGRPIHLELSNSLNINDAATWAKYSNGWRTGGDIECYGCESGGSSYPLTSWNSISSRFSQVAQWQPYGGPGAFNDYDSIEVGNGSNDGLTLPERQTQLSLWALAASPFILGTDLTNLDPTDLALLKNTAVIGVDQDAIDASRIASSATSQVFAKTEKSGAVVAGLFNTGGQSEVVSTTAAALGLPTASSYRVDDLWTHRVTASDGTIAADVPSHGVALLRITPSGTAGLPPSATVDLAGAATFTGGTPGTATETFANNGVTAARMVRLTLSAPSGWTVKPASATTFGSVAAGQTVQASFQVLPPSPSGLLETDTLTGSASYFSPGSPPLSVSEGKSVTVTPPVQSPYKTFSSATDAPAAFGQSGQQFLIDGAGADLFSGSDAYSSIYQAGTVGDTATITTEITSSALAGFGKAGIMVRNDITGSGSSPEGVILLASPSGGIQLEWDSNGGNFIDSVTPPNGTSPGIAPVWLQLQRNGSTYTGYYSFDGTDWLQAGSATVTGQAATQDAGMFLTSHASGSPAQATFNGFAVQSGATPPPLASVYVAAAAGNTVAGGASIASCPSCYSGKKVGFVGEGGTVTYNSVTVPTAGTYQVEVGYLDGSGRQADVTVNGGTPQTVQFTSTGSFDTLGFQTVPMQLNAGTNTVEFSNPAAFAPDFNALIIPASP
jgi:alpha galactosidase A-like protein/alpha galactosidase C-like protein/alpha-galactosidase-like protein